MCACVCVCVCVFVCVFNPFTLLMRIRCSGSTHISCGYWQRSHHLPFTFDIVLHSQYFIPLSWQSAKSIPDPQDLLLVFVFRDITVKATSYINFGTASLAFRTDILQEPTA